MRGRSYLTDLAVRQQVAASTQRQALNALVFYYRDVVQRDLGDLGEFCRARRGPKIPVVLSRAEVDRLFAQLTGAAAVTDGFTTMAPSSHKGRAIWSRIAAFLSSASSAASCKILPPDSTRREPLAHARSYFFDPLKAPSEVEGLTLATTFSVHSLTLAATLLMKPFS